MFKSLVWLDPEKIPPQAGFEPKTFRSRGGRLTTRPTRRSVCEEGKMCISRVPDQMVYLYHITCLRYTILVRNPQYMLCVFSLEVVSHTDCTCCICEEGMMCIYDVCLFIGGGVPHRLHLLYLWGRYDVHMCCVSFHWIVPLLFYCSVFVMSVVALLQPKSGLSSSVLCCWKWWMFSYIANKVEVRQKPKVTTTNLFFHWWARCVSLSFVRRGIRAGAVGSPCQIQKDPISHLG